MHREIKKNPEIGEDIKEDHNKMNILVYASYFLKTIKLIVVILNVSYFLGVLWLIACELSAEYRIFILEDDPTEEAFISDNFFYYFDLHVQDYTRNTLIVMYYSFTSLSTVGFGDYHPRGNFERIICCFYLLFGVAIFSYIMGNFIEILHDFQKVNEHIDYGDQLDQFFGLLKRFNNNKNFNANFTERILQHFEYRWRTNKVSAFESEEDLGIYSQLPDQVQNTLF